ncbi:hypothetical protein C9975_07640 [Thalassospira xiamenensis]|nr:hypothetical protein C9975_07640 [Thalassospira xiamenensis]
MFLGQFVHHFKNRDAARSEKRIADKFGHEASFSEFQYRSVETGFYLSGGANYKSDRQII